MGEEGISFDDVPSQDHLLTTANKGRVSPPRKRLPSSSRQTDSLEEDFENLLKDEEIDIAEENLDIDVLSEAEEGGGGGGGGESYLDDFEALLAASSSELDQDCDANQHCDIEADFDALIQKENFVVQNPTSNNSKTLPEISQTQLYQEETKYENDREESSPEQSDRVSTTDQTVASDVISQSNPVEEPMIDEDVELTISSPAHPTERRIVEDSISLSSSPQSNQETDDLRWHVQVE